MSGMTKEQKVQHWIDTSDDDIITAKAMLTTKRLLPCGFFCHLAAEKSFKAAIVKYTDEVPPKIHNLRKLAQNANMYKLLSAEQINLMKRLETMQINARYPEYKDALYQTLDEAYFGKLIKETEGLLCWIKVQLEK
ncbi:MAG: HEPN domain-containing protein [Defluviitaleaceae bacterium]|nr:HEPN domain-containing protein [Defluviitaleaceae bacterium]